MTPWLELSGSNELAFPEVVPDVRNAAVGIEKDQVARPGAAEGRSPDVVLGVSRPRQRDAHQAEDVLHETRAVEARRAGSTENVGDAEKPHGARRQPHRDSRGPCQNAAGKAADPGAMRRGGGDYEAGGPLRDVRAQPLSVCGGGVFGFGGSGRMGRCNRTKTGNK